MTKNERFERGERLLRQVDGDKVADHLLERYETIAPDFTKYLIEFAFGEIYAREGDYAIVKLSRSHRLQRWAAAMRSLRRTFTAHSTSV